MDSGSLSREISLAEELTMGVLWVSIEPNRLNKKVKSLFGKSCKTFSSN